MNTKNVLVSVIIPAYNRAQYIEEAIKSVLAQTYSPVEMIVVDDGSADQTKQIVMHYNDAVIYIYQNHQGVSSARNKGIKEAHGNYIAFLDSDDVWIKNKLELQMNLFIQKSSVGLVYSDIVCFDGQGKKITKKHLSNNFYRGNVFNELFQKSFIPTCSVIVKKECFEKIGFFDGHMSYAEDSDMWLRISKEYEVDYVDQVLACFRLDTDDSLSKQSIEVINGSIISREKLLKTIKKEKIIFYKYAITILSDYYIQLGGLYFDKNNILSGVKCFIKAQWYCPLSCKVYFNFTALIMHFCRLDILKKYILKLLKYFRKIKKYTTNKYNKEQNINFININNYANDDIAIYCLHRVCEPTGLFYDRNISATPYVFEKMVCHLKKHCHFITMDDLVGYYHGKGSIKPHSIMLTFDDGYKDNAVNAFPVLYGYDIPAVVFITTQFIANDGISWQDILAYFTSTVPAQSVVFIDNQKYSTASSYERARALYCMCKELRYYTSEKRDEIINNLYCKYNMSIEKCLNDPFFGSRKFMDVNDIEYWSERNIDIGSHTKTHPVLTASTENDMLEEINDSKAVLEKITKKAVVSFAYPYGLYGDFNAQTSAILKNTGYKIGMSLIDGTNNKNSDPFQLKRIGINQFVDCC